MNTNRIITGDCFEELQALPAESIHACVTDPPYGLAFMGRDWDSFEPKEYQEWCEEWAREVKRVLKPGGHLLAFSGNRTHHRLFTGVEDAGFEIRDTLTWHYGSGFPKATDVSKTINKRADAEREVVGEHPKPAGNDAGGNSLNMSVEGMPESANITEPATDAAKKWDGWKTGLKPATEYVVMARKPFDGATVDCVLEHGTGALNVDGCRIDTDGDGWERHGDVPDIRGANYSNDGGDRVGDPEDVREMPGGGRYPANVVFDADAAAQLDADVGETTNHDGSSYDGQTVAATGETYGEYDGDRTVHSFDDSGGPSRYFYTSKATKAERTLDGKIDNAHPTVKPQDLMEWLVKLVTREEQVVIDPFCGSGTTCMAAKQLNREFIGIEKQAKCADVARVRCNLTPENPAVVREHDSQHGLESFTD